MSGHCVGTHEAALRLALGLDELPDIREDASLAESYPLSGKNILDIGSGPNPFPWVAGGPSYIAGRQTKVTVDLPEAERPDMHEIWSDVHYSANIIADDSQELRQISGVGYDLIVGIELIEHLENPWLLMRRIGQWLKIDGICVISTPNVSNLRARKYYMKEGYMPWFTPSDIQSTGHITPIFPHLMREMADRAGLEITAEAYNEPPPHWIEQATQKEITDITQNICVYRLERKGT